MLPSYSVRRGRLTAQLTCRTGTSYTPELCKTGRHYTQKISDSQYTLILRNHLGAHTRAEPGMLRYYLVHHTYVRSHTQLSCGPYMLAIGSWSYLGAARRRPSLQQQALAYHPEPPHKPQHELSALRVLCALCVPFLRTFSYHTYIKLLLKRQ